MGRVISLRLSDAEDARLSGAAAITGMSVSAYLKWLLSNGKTGNQSDTEMILRRLDELAITIANVGGTTARKELLPAVTLPPRKAIVTRLKERGLPSSTIRQVEAALDELEGKIPHGVPSS